MKAGGPPLSPGSILLHSAHDKALYSPSCVLDGRTKSIVCASVTVRSDVLVYCLPWYFVLASSKGTDLSSSSSMVNFVVDVSCLGDVGAHPCHGCSMCHPHSALERGSRGY